MPKPSIDRCGRLRSTGSVIATLAALALTPISESRAASTSVGPSLAWTPTPIVVRDAVNSASFTDYLADNPPAFLTEAAYEEVEPHVVIDSTIAPQPGPTSNVPEPSTVALIFGALAFVGLRLHDASRRPLQTGRQPWTPPASPLLTLP